MHANKKQNEGGHLQWFLQLAKSSFLQTKEEQTLEAAGLMLKKRYVVDLWHINKEATWGQKNIQTHIIIFSGFIRQAIVHFPY